MTGPAPLLIQDYGPGSCLSCGDAVASWIEHDPALPGTDPLDQLQHVDRCPTCGEVATVVFVNDCGDPLQGFMRIADLMALPGHVTDDDGQQALF